MVLVILIGLTVIAAVAIRNDRQLAQYPGSARISSHANYSRLPFYYHWDDAYQTADSFPSVYNWYSTSFHMGAEAEANGACILLESSSERMVGKRTMSVLICETPKGRMAFVNRSTSLR